MIEAPGAERLRVLVVDDFPDSARMLADAVRGWGYDVVAAMDGPAALDAVRSFPPDVALLDWIMPGMNGVELAGRLRALAGPRTLVCIAVTGCVDALTRERLINAGLDHVVPKPVDLDELAAALRLLERTLPVVAAQRSSAAVRAQELLTLVLERIRHGNLAGTRVGPESEATPIPSAEGAA
jgi:two-component system OmpR family response regulator